MKSRSSTERAGIHGVGLIITEDLQWIFREQPIDDYGIDAHIEIWEDDYPSGSLIGAQIKSGKSYLAETTDTGYVYRGELKHLDYWLGHALPVIVVVRDPDTKTCWWQVVSEETATRTDKGWKLEIPFDNALTAASRANLLSLVGPTGDEQRRTALAMARVWMEYLREGKRLILEAEEWINKSMGRGSLKLTVIDDDTGDELEISDWPFVMFPGQVYADILPHLFPWATFYVDDDFYYDYDLAHFQSSYGMYDGEDGVYFYDHEEFREWRQRLAPIRPYEIAAGEVAAFRLEIALNELGQAFLVYDDFVADSRFPAQREGDDYTSYRHGLKSLAIKYGLTKPDDE